MAYFNNTIADDYVALEYLDENNELECVIINPNSYCGMEYKCTDYPSDNQSPLNFD